MKSIEGYTFVSFYSSIVIIDTDKVSLSTVKRVTQSVHSRHTRNCCCELTFSWKIIQLSGYNFKYDCPNVSFLFFFFSCWVILRAWRIVYFFLSTLCIIRALFILFPAFNDTFYTSQLFCYLWSVRILSHTLKHSPFLLLSHSSDAMTLSLFNWI